MLPLRFVRDLIRRNPGEPEFHQAVREQVDDRLQTIIKEIHGKCVEHGTKGKPK